MRRRLRLAAVLLAAALAGCSDLFDSHPPDAQLVQELRDRRQLYEQLLKMVREEKRVTRIGRDFIHLADRMSVSDQETPLHLPPARYAQYRRLFDALELESGVERLDDGSFVAFLRSSVGLGVSGSSKSLVWEPGFTGAALAADDPRALRDTCSGQRLCDRRRRIEDGWYIRYQGG